jgi:acyl-coenzyme A synthetase/AMP-(fatty) acid ligase
MALPRHKIPAEIRLVKALPKNSSDKVDRQACLEALLMHAGREDW